MRLTRRGERLIEMALSCVIVTAFLMVLGFAGWIEGGCGGNC